MRIPSAERTALLIVAIVLGSSLTGCGQKGPLVLPDAQHPRKKLIPPLPRPPVAPTAPASDGTTPPR